MPDSDLIYWDACVWLSYINGDRQERLDQIDPLFLDAQAGTIRIVTSSLSMVEVAFGKKEQDRKLLDPTVEEKINKLWQAPTIIAEFYGLLGQDAKSLMRQALEEGPTGEKWSLKAIDAIHLATARRVQATEFHTYDPKLPKFASMVGIPIKEPEARQMLLPGTGGVA